MDEGLFFWLIIVAVAVLQGIGQKKKKPGKPGQRLPGSKPRGQQARTLNRPRPTGPVQGGADMSSDEGTSSEAMIPSDIWEEILGLARGTPGGKTPKQAPSSEVEEAVSLEAEERVSRELHERDPRHSEQRAAPLPEASRSDHTPAAREFPTSHGANAVHHGTRPSEAESRLGVPRRAANVESESHSESVRAGLFGGGTLKELRKAIVHQEVLGKPVALREES